jgi:hypothetical protein
MLPCRMHSPLWYSRLILNSSSFLTYPELDPIRARIPDWGLTDRCRRPVSPHVNNFIGDRAPYSFLYQGSGDIA